MRSRVLLSLAVVLAFSTVALAQPSMQPVTYYAEFHVKPGMEEQFMNQVKKYDEPMFAKLMQEGAVLAWGVDIPVLHSPGAPSHSIWWAMPDLGALDKVFAAFEENEKKIKEEEAQAAEEARRRRRPVPKTSDEMFRESVDIGQHRDWLLRSQLSKFTSGQPPADIKPYSLITVVRVKPGRAQDFRRWIEAYIIPTYNEMVDNGSIIGWEFGTEEVKSTDDFTHYFWVVLPNLAAREKARAAFAALSESRSPETREHIGQAVTDMIDSSSLRNFLVRTVYLRVPQP